MKLIHRVRKEIGDNFIVGIRISGDEHTEGGLTIKETSEIAFRLAKAGLDYVHLSSGSYEALPYLFPDREGTMIADAAAIKRAVDVTVICPNIHDPVLANRIIQSGKADMVSLGRSLLCDPEWPLKGQQGRNETIRKCIFCYYCVKSLRSGWGVKCSVNRMVGRERFDPSCYPRFTS